MTMSRQGTLKTNGRKLHRRIFVAAVMIDFDMCSVNELIHSCAMVRLISSSLLAVHCTWIPSWTKESAMSTMLPATSAVSSEWADVAWIFIFCQFISFQESLKTSKAGSRTSGISASRTTDTLSVVEVSKHHPHGRYSDNCELFTGVICRSG